MSGMNDDRRPQSGRSIREIVSDATDRELKDFATGNLTPDELVAMAAAEERRRKRRMRRISGIAALFVIVLACGAFFVCSTFTTDVDADKNPKEEIVTEDGVIIEDGGWEGNSEHRLIVNNWEELQSVKVTIPELRIPKYIPDGYDFKELVIEESENAISVQYYFMGYNGEDLLIQEYLHGEQLESMSLYDTHRKYDTKKGVLYFIDNKENKTAAIQLEEGCLIEVITSLDDIDVIKIVESIE